MRVLVLLLAAVVAAVTGTVLYVAWLAQTAGSSWRVAYGRALVGLPSGPLGWIGAGMLAVGKRRMNAAMAERLDLQLDDDLLDVGCGSAVLLAEHASHISFVAGLDASDIQVSLARKRLAGRIADGTAEIVKGDAGSLPWEDDRFSVVTSIDSVKCFADPAEALAEIHRVLRPGGRAVLMLGERIGDAVESGELDVWGQWQWNEADARRLMEDAGFADVSISILPRGGAFGPLGVPDAQLARGLKRAGPATI